MEERKTLAWRYYEQGRAYNLGLRPSLYIFLQNYAINLFINFRNILICSIIFIKMIKKNLTQILLLLNA